MVALPPKLTFVTLGTNNLPRRRSFYSGWGWDEREGGSDEFAQYTLGSVRLVLYPLDLLGSEATPGCSAPSSDWNGVTLAVNVANEAEVDAGYRVALHSGAQFRYMHNETGSARPDGRSGVAIIEHCTGVAVRREPRRRQRFTGRVLSSAFHRHVGKTLSIGEIRRLDRRP